MGRVHPLGLAPGREAAADHRRRADRATWWPTARSVSRGRSPRPSPSPAPTRRHPLPAEARRRRATGHLRVSGARGHAPPRDGPAGRRGHADLRARFHRRHRGSGAAVHTGCHRAGVIFGLDHGYRSVYQLRGTDGWQAVEPGFTPAADHRPVIRLARRSGTEEIELAADDRVTAAVAAFARAVGSSPLIAVAGVLAWREYGGPGLNR